MRALIFFSSFFLSILPVTSFAQDSSSPIPFAPLDSKNTVSMEFLEQFTKNPQSIPPDILSIITNSESLEPPTILHGTPQITQEMTTFSKEAPITGKINRPLVPTANGFVLGNDMLYQNAFEQQLLKEQIPSLSDPVVPKISKGMFHSSFKMQPLQPMQSMQSMKSMQIIKPMQSMQPMEFQDLKRLQIVAAKTQEQIKQEAEKKAQQNKQIKEDTFQVKLPKLSESDKALNQIKIQELEEKAKADDEKAKIQLAQAYFYGLGGEKKLDRAFQLMEENARRGSAVAMLELGKMYEAESPRKNIMRSANYYKQASDYGNIEGKYHLGLLYYKGKFGQGDDALKHAIYAFREGLAKEHAPSMFQLATMYEKGVGFEKDMGQAVQLYRKSAHLGYAPAQLQVGLLYENGILVPKNATLGAAWYTKAAEQGNALAQYLLAGMYRQGNGVPKNMEVAKLLYEHAAKADLLDAQFDLGVFYLIKSPYQDEKKAEYWLQQAADKNDIQAKEILMQLNQKKDSTKK